MSLLRIDVEAEIRKLSGRRFRTAADYAVELVRWVASQRPMRVEIRVSRRELEVSHDGSGLVGASLRRLAAVFDPRRTDEERHAALVALEREHGLGPLSAFAARSPRVTITGMVDGRPLGLEIAVGRRPRSFDVEPREGFSIRVRGRGRRPRLERRLLRESCRWSTVPIRIDGRVVSRGLVLDDCLLQVDLHNPRMLGVVGLPRSSDLVRIERLRHGVRAEELVRPPAGGMVYHAAADERDDDLDASWRTLRRAARKLYERLAQRCEELGGADRSRALELLFDRYEHTQESSLLSGVKAFLRVGAPPIDLEAVRRLTDERRLFALDSSERVEDYDVSGREVLRLDQLQRRFLLRQLAAVLPPPPRRVSRGGFSARLRAAGRFLRDSLARLLGGGPGRPLPDDELDPAELRFLEAVRGEIRSGAFSLPDGGKPFEAIVRMAEGQRRPWTRRERFDGRTQYLVARGHPLVEQMVDSCDDEPSYIYPAMYALTDGHDGYGDDRSLVQRVILDRLLAGP